MRIKILNKSGQRTTKLAGGFDFVKSTVNVKLTQAAF